MSHQVFISYSSLDKKFAEKIYEYLKKNGITCWISSKDIPAGGDYQACIVEAIHQAQIVLLIFSANANSSSEIAKELSLASKKVLIPTRIEDVIPAGAFQYQLSNRQFIDLFEDFDNSLQELAHRIESALKGVQHVSLPRKRKAEWKKPAAISLGLLLAAGVGVGGWMVKGVPLVGGIAANPLTPANTDDALGKAAAANGAATPSSPAVSVSAITAPSAAAAASEDAKEKVVVPVPVATQAFPPQPARAATPEGEVADKVKVFVATIKDKTENSREAVLRNSKDSLPTNLNAAEASLLLAKTGFYRASSIGWIVDNLAEGQSGEAAAVILGDTSDNSRLSAIQSLVRAGKIKSGLSGVELAAILRNSGFYRSSAITVLAENLQANLDGVAMALVLGDAVVNSRLTALQGVVKAGKIKNDLSASDAVMILKNTDAYRATAIGLISENLAAGLNGDAVAAILGDTQDNSRLDALRKLVRATKIKSDLQPAEAVAILKNTEAYRGNAISQIAENLAGSLNGAAVVAILGNSINNSRLDALNSLVRAGKLKQGMNPDDVQNIVKNMEGYMPTAMKALAPFLAK